MKTESEGRSPVLALAILLALIPSDSQAQTNSVGSGDYQESRSVEQQLNDEVSACWYRPKFAQGTNVEPVRIFFAVNRDGYYQMRPVVLDQRLDGNRRVLAQRALKGLNRCAPFKTVKNNPSAYDKLHKIELTFYAFPKQKPQGR
jgi:hypothetical protein